MFFALKNDIEEIIKSIENQIAIKYYKSGLLDNKDVPNYNSILDIPNIGFVQSGDWNRTDSYLILKKKASLKIESVPQRKGGKKFGVDQLKNSKSITLKLGGIYLEEENILVGGRIVTVSSKKDSLEIYKLFSDNLKKNFKRIGAFYVGKLAEEKLNLGWRLVTNDKSPKEYDLCK